MEKNKLSIARIFLTGLRISRKWEESRLPNFAPVALPKIKLSFTVAENSQDVKRDQVLKRVKMPPRPHVKDKVSQRDSKFAKSKLRRIFPTEI